MGRASTARERLLDAACRLMQERGYGSVGVAEICTHADVRKGSFYHFFESKQSLTVETIDAHWRDQRATWLAALDVTETALAGLESLFRATTTVQRRSREAGGAITGCLFGNMALELSSQDAVVRARLEAIFDEQIALIHATLDRAAAEGSIPPASASRATARAALAQLEGMVLFAKLANDPDLLDDLWAQTRLLLGGSETPARGLRG